MVNLANVQLREMQKGRIHRRVNLHENAILAYFHHLDLVNGAKLKFRHIGLRKNGVDPLLGFIHGRLVGRKDVEQIAILQVLRHVDARLGHQPLGVDPADTKKLGSFIVRYDNLLTYGHCLLGLCPRLPNDFIHNVENVRPRGVRLLNGFVENLKGQTVTKFAIQLERKSEK